MSSVDAKGNKQTRWNTKRAALIVLVIVITAIVLTIVIGASLHQPKRSVTSFTCYPKSNEQVFTLEVEIDLTDGMDENEANKVAKQAYLGIYETSEPSTRKQLYYSTESQFAYQEGVWTVEFSLFYELTNPVYTRARHQREDFEAIISPATRTVTYNLTRTEW